MQPGCRAANAAGQASLSVVQAQLATQRRAKAPSCITATEVALHPVSAAICYIRIAAGRRDGGADCALSCLKRYKKEKRKQAASTSRAA